MDLIMRYLIALLFCFSLAAQQTVNNFTVKTNLVVGNNLTVTNEATIDGVNIGKGAGNAAGSTRVGRNALNGSATGTGNTAVGDQAGLSLTTGISNTLIGNNAGPLLTSSGHNVVVGKDALFNATFGDTVPGTFGYTNGAHNNIILGVNAYYNLLKGRNNFGAGTFSGFALTNGSFNVALGTHTLNDLIAGDGNTAIGESSLYKTTGGFYNTALGYLAGFNASANSERNVYLGFNSGPSSLTTENNKLYIHNAQGTPLIGGDFSAYTVTIAGRLGLGVSPDPNKALTTKNTGGILVENPNNVETEVAILATGTAFVAFGYNGSAVTNAYGARPNSAYFGTAQQRDVWIGSAGGRVKISTPDTVATHVQIQSIPTAVAGLASGTLWSDSGTIKSAPTTNTSSIGDFVVSSSGRGVDFTATANGSGTMTSELLNDYEEGSWSPQYTNLTPPTTPYTMDVVSAKYTKIGRQVTVNAWIRTTAVNTAGASGALRVSGLPYTAATYPDGYAAVAVAVARDWGVNFPCGGYVNGGANVMTLEFRATSSGATADMSAADLINGANKNMVVISATYFTN